MTDFKLDAINQGVRDLTHQIQGVSGQVQAHDRSADSHARDIKTLLQRQVEVAESLDSSINRMTLVAESGLEKMTVPPWAAWLMRVIVALTATVVVLAAGEHGAQVVKALFSQELP